MPRQRDTRPLPAVLAAPDSADRLATELTLAAQAVAGDDPLSADRRRFLARAAVQVAGYGTDAGTAEPAGEFRPALVGDDLQTREATG